MEMDREIEKYWDMFADVPMNPETECIEESLQEDFNVSRTQLRAHC